jgi:hypothetical protein
MRLTLARQIFCRENPALSSRRSVCRVLNFARKVVISSTTSCRKWRADKSCGRIRRWPHREQYSSASSAEQLGQRDSWRSTSARSLIA